MHGVSNAKVSHTGWGKSRCNIIYWALPGSSSFNWWAAATSPQLSVSPDARDQPLAVFSVVHRFDVNRCSLNTRFILWKRNIVCKRTFRTPGVWFWPPSAPVTYCSWFQGELREQTWLRRAVLVTVDPSFSAQDSRYLCEQVSLKTSPHKHKRRKPAPMETSQTTEATLFGFLGILTL